jgi:peptidoglycan pentaglycine glycine transferase (the first glycine)
MAILNASEWDAFLEGHPEAHILQTSSWGELKAGFGWQAIRVQTANCGAQVLFKLLPLGFTIAYIPRGPVGDGWSMLWPEIHRLCRRMRAILLKVDPDVAEGLNSAISSRLEGFICGSQAIQPRRTVVLSLEGSEEEWLERMKQKTRYNIRLAQKKEVIVHPSRDMHTFHKMMLRTGERDQFGVHSEEYFQRAYNLFSPSELCTLLQADVNGKPVAGLMAFAFGVRAWYFYGASTDEERNRMPTYLLQFEAMRWAAQKGSKEYDLWGVPDFEENELESKFNSRSDGLWGVYRFKRGFGGKLVRSAPAYDYVYNAVMYKLYQFWLSKRIEG